MRSSEQSAAPQPFVISNVPSQNIEELKLRMGNSPDFVTKQVTDYPLDFSLCFIDGLVDKASIEESILRPLLTWMKESELEELSPVDLINRIEVFSPISSVTDSEKVMNELLHGAIILFVENYSNSFVIPMPQWQGRNVEEPKAQTLVTGPREGFVETLSINTSLMRRRIANPNLRFEKYTIGRITKTEILISYLDGTVDQAVLEQVRLRIQNIETNKVFDVGMIEELIEKKKYSPFPTLHSSERPDTVCAAIAEGKVVIMMEGTPFMLIAPATFFSFFQASEDYYHRFDLAILIRFIRFTAFFISMLLPALYVAVTTFHQELIQTNLLISLAAQREGVPFPSFAEALVMEVIFEILREAGIRMPRPIGPAVSIVGAIVIGEAAVAAGLVSPVIVIVVSLTAISSFVAPYYAFSGTARLLRFFALFIAAFTGMFGLFIFLIALIIHMASLNSFGRSYLTPLSPMHMKGLKDSFIRLPVWIHQWKLLNKGGKQ
ncbi:spore germination protein KA [Bacillus ectoiniformans]|uniref:spore germination protein n=1 Tax=Bacillus ectoiniformans TaxID=1494429 RepID=UPI00195E213A|nr:spore germination protein [Bacillus ectoiniformans]MBM7648632.1 spore germination protein KA [Bacillus ectoiniformans]